MKGVAVFLAIILFFPQAFVNANIVINEVMYDIDGADTGREWIELFNSGSEAVDISAYRLIEADTNHKFSIFQGDKSVPSLGYAIVTSDKYKFKKDWPNFMGTIFDSTFSLNNQGETLSLKDMGDSVKDKQLPIKDTGQNVLDKFTYSSSMGGAGDGKSLQKIGGVWSASKPTPGFENKAYLESKLMAISAPKSTKISPKVVTMKIPKTEPLVASPIESNEANVALKEKDNLSYYIGFLGLVLCLGVWIIHTIRVKNNRSHEEANYEEFEILD